MADIWYDYYCVICGNGFDECHTLDLKEYKTVMLYDRKQDERLRVCPDCVSAIQKVINKRYKIKKEWW